MTYLPHDWQLGSSLTWASGLPYSVISRFFSHDNEDYLQLRTRYGFTVDDPTVGRRFESERRNSERNDATLDINLNLRKTFVMGHTSAAAFLEVFNLLNANDLRIFTFEPNKGKPTPASSLLPVNPLQIDGERRFGRRFQVGIQLSF